jgi:hypothetical protein
MARTPEQGADTAIWLAASPEAAGRSGEFWVDRKAVPCKFRDAQRQAMLWSLCESQLQQRAAA